MQTPKVKRQGIIPSKRFNRYKTGDKVLLFSNTYRYGVVFKVWIEEKKSHKEAYIGKRFKYLIKFKDGTKEMKCYEDELLPYLPKWQWKILGWLKIIY